jgi:hypothetical protein
MNFDGAGNQTDEHREPLVELLGRPVADFVIAYISCLQDSARNYLGAILLTDYRTRPLEFAFVSPVKITTLQRIIHGRTLDEAITVDLVTKRLLTEATKRPDIVFVDSDLLLEAQRLTKTPVAKLSRHETLAGQPNSLSTVKFSTANGGEHESAVGSVLSALEPLADLIEPFARMTEAIREALEAMPPPQPKP